jgi:hypothetical protein
MGSREDRIAVLKQILADGNRCKVEDLLRQGFPASAAYPAYWYSASPGSRLAFEVGCRVVFSRKLMQIELVRLTDSERGLQEIRIERARLKSVERTREIHTFLKLYERGQLDADIDGAESDSDD